MTFRRTYTPRRCRVCGRSEADCRDRRIRRTFWVEPDLCNHCAPKAKANDAPPSHNKKAQSKEAS